MCRVNVTESICNESFRILSTVFHDNFHVKCPQFYFFPSFVQNLLVSSYLKSFTWKPAMNSCQYNVYIADTKAISPSLYFIVLLLTGAVLIDLNGHIILYLNGVLGKLCWQWKMKCVKYNDWFSAPPTNRTATLYNVRLTKNRYNLNSLRVKAVCKGWEIKHCMPSGTKMFSKSAWMQE